MSKNFYFFLQRSCIRKRKYKSFEEGIKKILQNREKNIFVDSVYRCPICRCIHIGHYGVNHHKRKEQRRMVKKFLKEKK